MRITFLGQAGLFIETRAGSILCDPWFNSAYFGSWFPFPANDGIDPARIANPTYLYISHLHHDHFDPGLAERPRQQGRDSPAARLPDRRPAPRAPRPRLPAFVETGDAEPMAGLRLMIIRPDRPDRWPDRRLCPARRRRRDARC